MIWSYGSTESLLTIIKPISEQIVAIMIAKLKPPIAYINDPTRE